MSKKLIVLVFIIICSCGKSDPTYYYGSNISFRLIDGENFYSIIEDRHIYCIKIHDDKTFHIILNATGADRLFDYTLKNIGRTMEVVIVGRGAGPRKIMDAIGAGSIHFGIDDKLDNMQIKILKEELPQLFRNDC